METRARNPRGHGDRLRVALIDAASDLLAEVSDVSQLSVRLVTARAGVSANALYLHFADMGELALAVKDRGFDELRQALADAEAAEPGDARAKFRAACHAYVAFALGQPSRYRVLFQTHIPGGKKPSRTARTADSGEGEAAGSQAFNDLVRRVAACLPEGRDAFPPAVQIWVALHGYATLQPVMRRFPFPAVDELVTGLEEAHLRG